MTEDKKLYNLSRRKVLGGIGAVGLASAGAGLGTSAYFNDTEAFTGNTITAGQLDLKLDYRATYAGGPGRLADIQSMDPKYADAEEIGDGVYLLDQVPDTRQEELEWETRADESFNGCAPDGDSLINGEEGLIFNLSDVKPGDSGETTMSFHICDNPAHVWMGGSLVSDLENGVTEPESDVDSTSDSGELAEAINARVWYDEDCNNIYGGDGESLPLDAVLVLDVSGSMDSGNKYDNMVQGATSFVNAIGPNDRVGIVTFSDNATTIQGLTSDVADLVGDLDNTTPNGGDADIPNPDGLTAMDDGIIAAHTLLNAVTRSSQKAIVFLSDGQNNDPDNSDDPVGEAQSAKDDDITVITIGLELSSQTAINTLQDMASGSSNYYGVNNASELPNVYSTIVSVLAGEKIIAEGTLREVMDAISAGIRLDGDRSTEDVECFSPDYTQCLGFEWELPPEVGNEVQTDSVEFDVKFVAQQCRHNDSPVNPFAQLG